MNYRLKLAVLLFSLMITCAQLFAQSADTISQIKKQTHYGPNPFRTWSIGVHTGISTTYTFLSNNKTLDFTSPDMQTSFGGYIKDQLTNSFGLQADFMIGKLQGDHSQDRFPSGNYIYSTFNTKLNWSVSLNGNFIFAHINLKNKKGLIQPYFALGGGMLNSTSQIYTQQTKTLYNPNTTTGFFVPVGLGLKIDLSRGINLDIGYQVSFVSSDNLDGYIYGSNNDKFSYSHIGLEFALGKSSKQQLATQKKGRPVHVEHIAPARILKAPAIAQQPAVDSTQIKHDRLKAELDSTNAQNARLNYDSDGDGVPDIKDKCPNTPAGTKVDSAGCPIVAPVVKSDVKSEIKAEDRLTVKTAIQNLEFFPGTSIIHSYSLNGLDQVAELLKNKKLRLRLEGNTDSAGKPEDNFKLSKERAEAVKLYLVGRGVNPDQIETIGYGAAHPIATNKTAAGRRLNRRVDFVLL
ncbi:MAG: OmpA family protein [Sphingobacteriales bacterium]